MRGELNRDDSQESEEYPRAVTVNGVRMPLAVESRWTRLFLSTEPKMWQSVSRFKDGSAKITLHELAAEWPGWTKRQRGDFCGACHGIRGQEDFPDILRFIMRHGSSNDCSEIAISVARNLPREEAFHLLVGALKSTPAEGASNITQGISLTKHPEAEGILREYLAQLWPNPSLWENADFLNELAYGAICCIQHLIYVGAPPEDFTEKVQALEKHQCARNRDSCRRFLRKYYLWLAPSSDL